MEDILIQIMYTRIMEVVCHTGVLAGVVMSILTPVITEDLVLILRLIIASVIIVPTQVSQMVFIVRVLRV